MISTVAYHLLYFTNLYLLGICLVHITYWFRTNLIISSFFLYIFCRRDISRTESTIIFKFSQYVCQYQESTGEAFQCDHSTMTSSRRHFVFSRYHWYLHNHSSKLTKFNAHKLQAICQHTDNPCPCALPNPRTCARVKILTCSKSPINNFEYEPGHLEHFKISRPYVSARALCALTARGKVKIQNCCMIWIPLTIIDNFHSFAFTLDLS